MAQGADELQAKNRPGVFYISMINVREIKEGTLLRVCGEHTRVDVEKRRVRDFRVDEVAIFLGYKVVEQKELEWRGVGRRIAVDVQLLKDTQTFWIRISSIPESMFDKLPEDVLSVKFCIPWLDLAVPAPREEQQQED